MAGRTLTPQEASHVYDRIGRLQDWQGFYERPAVRALEAHCGLDSATSVFELGCGTGAHASRWLSDTLAPTTMYRGVDVSPRMIELASRRLERFGDRARVDLVSGHPPLPGEDGSFDRFLALYVFDLLSADLSVALLAEARRLLEAGGRLCLVGLTSGESVPSRAVTSIWKAIWRRSPSLLGGCRPVDVTQYLGDGWQLEQVQTVTAWGITSQVVVARPNSAEP